MGDSYILHNDTTQVMTDEHDGSVDLSVSVTLLCIKSQFELF